MESGASQHIYNEKDVFCSFKRMNVPKFVKIGAGTTLQAEGKGNICISAYKYCKFSLFHFR